MYTSQITYKYFKNIKNTKEKDCMKLELDFDTARIKIEITEVISRTHFWYKRANKDRWAGPRELDRCQTLELWCQQRKNFFFIRFGKANIFKSEGSKNNLRTHPNFLKLLITLILSVLMNGSVI